MSALRSRIVRLEADRGKSASCRLCELLALTLPDTAANAAELARHRPHTLEQLVMQSLALNEPGDPRLRQQASSDPRGPN